ncbi:MAG: hypothetical protein B7Z75_13110 [Acidocella sp. 20-57-95]|nr:MAG: hypothetical protein B7Z75_13110 [Acidocella sp. 20-57-95]OYV60035.1 MAG: hypothetical protein B7Z71_06920 [Acidocella sp. 21-58-7]HQT65582.1 DUF1800 domain-containing protein [Acidocella sp.]HQU03469.1 DUF1800 domain-containing protein [Acidocella sp.]
MNKFAAIAHVRFGLGLLPGQSPDSDPKAALKAQLQGPDPAQASGAFDSLPRGIDAVDTLRGDAMARKAALADGMPKGAFKPKARALYEADAAAQMGWAATTQYDFRERLVWFWTNHFTVSIYQNQTASLVGPMIREAIRPYVNGNFTDMVLAVERHPAMLRYLANENSVGPNSPAGLRSKRGLNENLGRECMELHTVGLKAGYTQTDVTNMAKILTGWSVAGTDGGGDNTGFKYRPFAHEPGPQTVMGNSYDGGEQAGIDALTYLSKYPTTYQLIATKLATHFIADTPPPHTVAQLAGILTETGGDLAAASAALLDLPEAWSPLTKLKTPQDFLISTVRAAPPPDGKPLNYPAIMTALGQPLWGAPLPNGWPDVAASWDGADAILSRINWAYTYAARFNAGDAGVEPPDIATASLGPLLRPATISAMAAAGSRREAVTMLLSAPEFQRR